MPSERTNLKSLQPDLLAQMRDDTEYMRKTGNCAVCKTPMQKVQREDMKPKRTIFVCLECTSD